MRAREPIDDRRSLRHVRAAQLRARAVRWAIGKSVFGSLFLLGALSYALGPEPRQPGNLFWMGALVLLSTVHVGLGLRTFSRARKWASRFWLPATLTWGVLSATLLSILIRR
jgi:hypothetical protein